MNQDSALKFLISALGDFWFHQNLLMDLAALIARTGYETKFFNLLLVRLKYLRDHGVSAIRHEEFEPLTNADGIYSMHLAGRGFNIRILYSFAQNGTPILLLGFFKRDGKKQTDYTRYIPQAQQRLAEELEAHKHES